MSTFLGLIISVILFISFLFIIFKKIRPWWKKLLLLLLVMVAFYLVTSVAFIIKYQPAEGSGPHPVLEETVYYEHMTNFEGMETKADQREIEVVVWRPKALEEDLPLIIFSHGSFGVADSNPDLFNELASQGYMVASLSHPHHSFKAGLSNGDAIYVDGGFFKSVMTSQGSKDVEETMKRFRQWQGIRVEDINFVLDKFLEDPAFKDMIDQKRIVLAGHSLGGAAALQVGRQRHQDIQAVISLEAPFFGDITGIEGEEYTFTEEVYPIPILHIYSDALWGKLGDITTYKRNQEYIDKQDPKFVNVHISGVGHIGLSELPSFNPILANLLDGGLNKKDNQEKVREINQACLNFLKDLEK